MSVPPCQSIWPPPCPLQYVCYLRLCLYFCVGMNSSVPFFTNYFESWFLFTEGLNILVLITYERPAPHLPLGRWVDGRSVHCILLSKTGKCWRFHWEVDSLRWGCHPEICRNNQLSSWAQQQISSVNFNHLNFCPMGEKKCLTPLFLHISHSGWYILNVLAGPSRSPETSGHI